MNPIDKDKFLFMYQQSQFSTLNDPQRGGLLDLLEFIEADTNVTDTRWASYMLATVHHETARTYLPIAEFGKGADKPYGQPDPVTGLVFYARGFIQLTWAGNYKTIGKILGVDLYNNPDWAMQPDIAYKIMSHGMRNGIFTGASLKRFFSDTVTDPVNARRIINGVDCAALIASYYDKFMAILTETSNV